MVEEEEGGDRVRVGGGGGAGGSGAGGGGGGYHPYPPALATYEDVVASPHLFMDALKNLHSSMGTKFMIPVVGGRDLDLHRLFVEVTSRGGIARVVKDRKWKEVTSVFSFPSSATNASFILRKYYVSLLYHYEQIYFFKANCWTPSPTDAMQHLSTVSTPPAGLPEYTRPNTAISSVQASSSSGTGSPVCGVIDGKFDGGYLITVRIGFEELKGVLYQVPESEAQAFPRQGDPPANIFNQKPGPPRRKRRKKSEIRRRDPAHPKPNRSGYNFFFAEQHAKLKPHYHGKDREISRIIGESWNKLQDHERAVYQEQALKDKERYKTEMEEYRERLRTGQIVQAMAPAPQQLSPAGANLELELENAATSAYMEENEATTEDKSNVEEHDDSVDKGSNLGECSQGMDVELKNVNVEVMADEAFDMQTIRSSDKDKTHHRNNGSVDNEIAMWPYDGKNDAVTDEGGISIRIEEGNDDDESGTRI